MQLSDTLVLGPIPPFRRPLRMRLAGLFFVLGAAFLGSALVLAVTPESGAALVDGLLSLVGVRPTPVPTRPAPVIQIDSQPSGATVLVDGRDAGLTPSTVAVPVGSQVVLRHAGFLDTLLANPGSQVSAVLWGNPEVADRPRATARWQDRRCRRPG